MQGGVNIQLTVESTRSGDVDVFWLYAFGFAVYVVSLQRCGSGQAPLYSEDTTTAN